MSAHRNYINGAWVESAAAPIVDRNPSDVDDVVGSYAAADAAQTRRAIEAAITALSSSPLLKPIMERLGDGYTYGEIRLVRATLQQRQEPGDY